MIGAKLAHYRVTAALGAGGMGEVWRAEDEKLGRQVALKVLPDEFARDPERMARFEREAKMLASLNHPNIATLFGLESVSSGTETETGTETVFLAMELVEGEDLSERLARGPIPIDEAILFALQISEALEAAHEAGIVHRDLKPANIKITEDGKVKVLDFGLAKAWETDGSDSSLSMSPTMTNHATMEGVILGTAAYMAPEQARGKKVDKRADIWAFGVVLWEMLTGSKLFEGDNLTDILAAVVRQEIDPTRLPTETPQATRDLIVRCLVRDPRNRLRDIGDARIELAHLPEAEEDNAVRSERPPLMNRRSFAVMSAMTGAGVVLGYGLGRRWTDSGTLDIEDHSIEISQLTGSGNVIDAAISPDGRFVTYVQSGQGLQSLWLRQLASGQTLRLISEDEVFFWGHTFSPDGNNVVFARKTPGDFSGAIYAVSVLGGSPRRLVSNVDSGPSYSADGTQMSYLRSNHPSAEESALMVADTNGANPKELAVFRSPEFVSPVFFSGPAWAPDGSHIVVSVNRNGSPTSEVRAWLASVSTADGSVSMFSDPGWIRAAQAGYLPDGRGLLVVARAPHQQTSQIWHVSAPDGEVSPVTNDLDDHRIVSLTSDGRALVSVSGDLSSAVSIGPLDGSDQLSRRTWSTLDGIGGVGFAPDGRLIYTTVDGGVWSLWTTTQDGSQSAPLLATNPGEMIRDVAVAISGDVYFSVRTPSGIDIRLAGADGGRPRVVVRDVGSDTISVSRDGVLVYTVAGGGTNRLYRLEPGASEPRAVSDRAVYMPSIEPSGQRIAFFNTDEQGRYRLGVISATGGELIFDRTVSAPSVSTRMCLREEGVYLTNMERDRANLWRMPLDGSDPEKLTAFNDQRLWTFAISDDGHTLAVTRALRERDAVLIKGFQGLVTSGDA